MKWLGGWIAIAVLLSGCDCGGGKGDSAAQWLDLEIEHPEIEEPEVVENQYGEIKNGLLTNTFVIHPAFVSAAPDSGAEGSAAPDPFAEPSASDGSESLRKRMTAEEVLEAYGVVFGPGTNAFYSLATGTLRVTQTVDQMDLVEAIIYSGCYLEERSISMHFEIFEVPAATALSLEQSADKHFEHSAEHDAVIKLVRENAARIVTTASFLSRSGQRTMYEDAEEIRYLKGTGVGEEDDTGTPLLRVAVEKVGTVIEADPVVGPDDMTLDVNFQVRHHLAPPVWPGPGRGDSDAVGSRSPRFHVGSISTSELILSGQTKLLCSWAVPAERTENPLRHLVFIKATIVRL